MSERSRIIEDVGMVLAILLGVAYGIAESLARIGICLRDCTAFDNSFPWGLLIVMLTLVAPKTLGKATTGQIWSALAGRIPGRTVTTTTTDKPEKPDA